MTKDDVALLVVRASGWLLANGYRDYAEEILKLEVPETPKTFNVAELLTWCSISAFSGTATRRVEMCRKAFKAEEIKTRVVEWLIDNGFSIEAISFDRRCCIVAFGTSNSIQINILTAITWEAMPEGGDRWNEIHDITKEQGV
jgi:hypothetical protein